MFNKDPLHYHTKIKFDQLLEKREKALWFEINGVKTWMPKKCCKLLNEDEKTVYIWTKVLESNMMKAREYIRNLNKDNLNKDNLNKEKQKKLVN
jgi:uncharacterized cysteine cluster protein YcgN (CxxCxxCC family)